MTDDHDTELRARLRAADPAGALPPVDPARVARLLEDAMDPDQSHDARPALVTTPPTTESRETGTRRRSPLTWLVAAAALVIIAGVGVFTLFHQEASDPTRNPGVPAAGGPSVTRLTAPGPASYSGRCLPPSPAVIGRQAVAFDGTVADITAGVVTLDVSHWYAGGPTDQVQVRNGSGDLAALIGAVRFRVGERYLVSATDGRVSVCGLSGPYGPRLAGLYERAFPGT